MSQCLSVIVSGTVKPHIGFQNIYKDPSLLSCHLWHNSLSVILYHSFCEDSLTVAEVLLFFI